MITFSSFKAKFCPIQFLCGRRITKLIPILRAPSVDFLLVMFQWVIDYIIQLYTGTCIWSNSCPPPSRSVFSVGVSVCHSLSCLLCLCLSVCLSLSLPPSLHECFCHYIVANYQEFFLTHPEFWLNFWRGLVSGGKHTVSGKKNTWNNFRWSRIFHSLRISVTCGYIGGYMFMAQCPS